MTNFLILLGLIVLGLAIAKWWEKHRDAPKASRSQDPLDTPLLYLTPQNRLTVRGLLNGGVAIFGRTGSGKTSGSSRTLFKGILRYPRSGGLLTCPKPGDKEMYQRWFAEEGRSEDLIVFEPGGKHRFAFLDYALKMGGDTREITRCMMTIGECLRGSDTDGMEDGKFWEQQAFIMLFNAVEIVKLATGTVDPWALQLFITTAAQSPAQLLDEEWRKSPHNKMQEVADKVPKTPIQQHDHRLAMDYWLTVFSAMADKMRSSVLAHVLGILHQFNTGIVREMVATTTTVSPDDMAKGRWLLVNMPPSEFGDSSALVYAGCKYLTQRFVLRRSFSPEDCIIVIHCDEAQGVVNSYDAHYTPMSRSHGGCMVYLTQSVASYYGVMGGKSGEHKTKTLLGNFQHQIFHASDAVTAKYASELLGKSLQSFVGASMDQAKNLWDEMLNVRAMSTNVSQQYSEMVQPAVFQNGLRTGGKENGLIVDSIVVRSGESFSNGQNWLWVPFSQQ